jgi:chemotaxis protein CheD
VSLAARVSSASSRAPGASEPGPPLPPPSRIYLAPGRFFVSATPAQVTTILGSCVAVCLWDPEVRAGGMNHFLLPEGVPDSPRFGQSAVPMLIQSVLDLGARRTRLRAKVFGGACVLEAFRAGSRPLGTRNVEVAREALRAAEIPVFIEDVGGDQGRKVVFDVQTGSAWVRAIDARTR